MRGLLRARVVVDEENAFVLVFGDGRFRGALGRDGGRAGLGARRAFVLRARFSLELEVLVDLEDLFLFFDDGCRLLRGDRRDGNGRRCRLTGASRTAGAGAAQGRIIERASGFCGSSRRICLR